MLFDVPIHDGYKVLTHSSTRRYDVNGYGQVGNELFPKHSINPQAVKKSSIYNKNISGISEAGYGQRYPYYGLSTYRGAGSPRSTVLSDYRGAGSPRGSVLKAYNGAGSPRNSVLKAYNGAGSPRSSILSDAYVNDNPGSGSSLRGVGRYGIPGRPSSRGPSLSGFLDTISDGVSSLFKTAVDKGEDWGSNAVDKLILKSNQPTPTPIVTTTTAKSSALPATILGMSATTAMIAAGVGAYLLARRK